MSAVAIDYIWQAIQESERTDDIQLMDDELLMKAEATRSALPRPDQPGTLSGEPIAATIGLKLVIGHSL